jgi:hypothetical protein
VEFHTSRNGDPIRYHNEIERAAPLRKFGERRTGVITPNDIRFWIANVGECEANRFGVLLVGFDEQHADSGFNPGFVGIYRRGHE